MKRSFLKLVGGAVFLLPLMFASCGNIDNPLEILDTSGSAGGGAEDATSISYLEYTVSGETATPTTKTLAEGAYTVVTADLAELTADKPYVVNTDVTIDHDMNFAGDVKIILCDGKKLIVKGYFGEGLTEPTHSLSIYGQSGQTGKLIVETIDGKYPIPVYDLNVHGGEISAKDVGTGNCTQGIYASHNLNIFNGEVEAFGTMEGVMVNIGGKLSIYGGSLEASAGATPIGQGGVGISARIFAYDGTIIATGGNADVDDQKGGVGVEGQLTLKGGSVNATGGDGKAGGSGAHAIQFGEENVVDYYSGKMVAIGGFHGSSGGVNGNALYNVSATEGGKIMNSSTVGLTYKTSDDGETWPTSGSVSPSNNTGALTHRGIKIE